MKKHVLWILALAMVLLCAAASADAVLNETVFPDTQFLAAVREFDTDQDGVLSGAEIAAVTRIDVAGRGIESLDGIGAFTALTHLNVTGNSLTRLDVSGLPSLAWLACDSNQLDTLVLGSLPALEVLSCENNWLTSLDLSGCPALKELYCGSNGMTVLDLSGNPALTTLFCFGSGVGTLNLAGCPALTTLSCYSCQISVLDLSGNPALTTLYCSNNILTSLDVSANPELKELVCHSNKLETLILAENDALETLDCAFNRLASLDVSSCDVLKNLVLSVKPDKSDGFIVYRNGDDADIILDESTVMIVEASTVMVDGLRYSVTATAATLEGVESKNVKKITIPATIKVDGKELKVTAIAANACKGLKKLTTVTIGKNVKKIGKNAFKGCGKLAKLVIKATKLTEKNVKAGAFSGLAADIEVTCPKGKADEYKTLLLARGLSETAVFK